jgi:hypothetical protein
MMDHIFDHVSANFQALADSSQEQVDEVAARVRKDMIFYRELVDKGTIDGDDYWSFVALLMNIFQKYPGQLVLCCLEPFTQDDLVKLQIAA